MKVLVTGDAGHLGRALTLTLPEEGHEPVGIDLVASGPTGVVGSITDVDLVRQVMEGVDVVLHTATLHEPHVATHSRHELSLDHPATGGSGGGAAPSTDVSVSRPR